MWEGVVAVCAVWCEVGGMGGCSCCMVWEGVGAIWCGRV